MSSPVEKADSASRARAMFAPFAGLAVLSVQQWLFFGREWEAVSPVQLVLWAVLALVALFFLMTGGLWFVPREVRAIADDELSRRSRSFAVNTGFIAAIVTALIVFAVSPFEPLSAQRAAHIICGMALGIALLVYGLRELSTLD